MNELQRELFKKVAECERALIEAIDARELAEEQDFYQLMQIVFEENCK